MTASASRLGTMFERIPCMVPLHSLQLTPTSSLSDHLLRGRAAAVTRLCLCCIGNAWHLLDKHIHMTFLGLTWYLESSRNFSYKRERCEGRLPIIHRHECVRAVPIAIDRDE